MTTLAELRKLIYEYGIGGGMIPVTLILIKDKEKIWKYEDTVYYCHTRKFDTCYKVEEYQTLLENIDKLLEDGWKKTRQYRG